MYYVATSNFYKILYRVCALFSNSRFIQFVRVIKSLLVRKIYIISMVRKNWVKLNTTVNVKKQLSTFVAPIKILETSLLVDKSPSSCRDHFYFRRASAWQCGCTLFLLTRRNDSTGWPVQEVRRDGDGDGAST